MRKERSFEYKSRSFTYLLPLLGESVYEFQTVAQCYMADKAFPEEEGKLYLLIEKDDTVEFNAYLKALTKRPMIDRYYHINDDYMMLVYKLTDDKKIEYYKFKNGQYSAFTEEYKEQIIKFHNLPIHSDIYKVLHRTEDKYREWEKRLGTKIPRTQEIGNMPTDMEIFDKEEEFGIKNEIKVNG